MTESASKHVLLFRCGHSLERFYIAREARRFAARAGLSARACSALAVGVAELVSNVARHAGGDGYVRLSVIDEPEPCIELIVHDSGPGIANFEVAVRDGFSRGKQRPENEPPRFDESLGVGLGAVVRLMDEVSHLAAHGGGTTIRALKRIRPSARRL